MPYERLEPCEGKLSRTVLRGGIGSDVNLLPELFSDTVKGAESSAVVYSLVETATTNGVAPYDYLLCLLKELAWLGKHPANDALDQLLPWHPYMKRLMEQQAK